MLLRRKVRYRQENLLLEIRQNYRAGSSSVLRDQWQSLRYGSS
jgi:hypothetical protein